MPRRTKQRTWKRKLDQWEQTCKELMQEARAKPKQDKESSGVGVNLTPKKREEVIK